MRNQPMDALLSGSHRYGCISSLAESQMLRATAGGGGSERMEERGRERESRWDQLLDKEQAAVITQYDQLLTIYVAPPLHLALEIRGGGWGVVNSKKEFRVLTSPLSQFNIYFLSLLVNGQVSLRDGGHTTHPPPTHRPVSMVNQPVTRYGETGGAPEKC